MSCLRSVGLSANADTGFARSGRPRRRSIAEAGFTLVEMLVVLAIIGLIVGLVAPRVFNQLAGAKVRAAHVQIASFKNAIDLFFLDVGRYPTGNEGLPALVTRPANLASWNGPYLKSGAVPRDPWNNAYVYRSPGSNGHQYEIVSFGSDGHDGGTDNAADITSW